MSPLGRDAGKGLGPDDPVNYLFFFRSEPQECGGGKRVRLWWRPAGTLSGLTRIKKHRLLLQVWTHNPCYSGGGDPFKPVEITE